MKRFVLKFAAAIAFFAFATDSIAQTWEKIYTGYNYIFRGMDFPEGQSQVGWLGGQSLTYMGDGLVLKTTNGGTSWTQLWTGTDQGVEGISFPDLNTGYVCGWSAYFAKTTNGGVSWTPQNPGTNIWYYTDVVFKNATHGIVTARKNSGNGVYFTTDGGTTWTAGTGIAGPPYRACYVGDDTYFLVTEAGAIQKSVNGGQTWTVVYSAGGILAGIDFYNPMTGIAAGEDGKIYKTYDGGTTWQLQVIAGGQPIWHDFAWASQDVVTAVGTPEIIYKSPDGGTTWMDDYPGTTYTPALYEALYTDDGMGYICGSQYFYRRNPQVVAGFSANKTVVCAGENVQFTDQSAGAPTSWNWTFEGGTPPTSDQQNPVVSYLIPGVYDVTLEVMNAFNSNTLFKNNMITVNSVPVAPVISSQGTVLSSNAPAGNQWFRDGTPINGANGQTYQATQTGWYWDIITLDGCNSDTSNHVYILFTGIGSDQKTGSQVAVYPNPTDGRFIISMDNCPEESCDVKIYNMIGTEIRTISTIPVNGFVYLHMDLSTFENGVYLIRIITKIKVMTRKVLVEK